MNRQPSTEEGVMTCPEFDLRMTLESGQTFHWTPTPESSVEETAYTGCIGATPFHLVQRGNELHYRGGPSAMLHHYFAFDHDLEAIRSSCSGHLPSHEAALACRGLRIMRQPHWECLATFILSPMKQVAHIRQMSLALRTAFGTPLPGTSIPSFPTPEVLANTTEADLRSCGLGFRAKSLHSTSRLIADGKFATESLVQMSTSEARDALCSLPGIGRKVANCILLFAYERLEAVPVDVWIARILGSFKSRKATPEQLESYGEKLLGPYAGYIQQYLFHQARTGKLLIPKKPDRKKSARRQSPVRKKGKKHVLS